MSTLPAAATFTQRWEQLWVWGSPEAIEQALETVEASLAPLHAASLSFRSRRDLWSSGHWVGAMFDWRLLSGPAWPRVHLAAFWRALRLQPHITVVRVTGARHRTHVRSFGAHVVHLALPPGVSHDHAAWSRWVATFMLKEWSDLRNGLAKAPAFQRAALNEDRQWLENRWDGVRVAPWEVEAWWEFMARFLRRRASPACPCDAWGPPVFEPGMLLVNHLTGALEEPEGEPVSPRWDPVAFYQEDTLKRLAQALPCEHWDPVRLNALIGPGLFSGGEQSAAFFESAMEIPLLEHVQPEEFWNLRQHRVDFSQLNSFAVVTTFNQLPLDRQLQELDAGYQRWLARADDEMAIAIVPLLQSACPTWPHWLALLEECAPEKNLVGAEELIELLERLRVEDRQKRLEACLPAVVLAAEGLRL